MRSDPVLLRRALVAGLAAAWIGGLAVYAGIVVPVAHGVLGSHREVGFVTRRVTPWLNLLGAAMAMGFVWDLRRGGGPAGRARRVALAVVIVAQAFLFAWHPVLDRLLDPASRAIAEPRRFYLLHRVYLWVAMLEWLGAVALALAALAAWRRADRAAG
ncbi:MAG: hypothetical protein IPM29_21435 [Planctomycetes bacterium]|nr:hypothetical protein [Planctomycetota bacterium]